MLAKRSPISMSKALDIKFECFTEQTMEMPFEVKEDNSCIFRLELKEF